MLSELSMKMAGCGTRRFKARVKLGNNETAYEDAISFRDAGGAKKVFEEMIDEIRAPGKIAKSMSAQAWHLDRVIPFPLGFSVRTAGKTGQGVFANVQYKRGDLIIAERPIYRVVNNLDDIITLSDIGIDQTNAMDTDALMTGGRQRVYALCDIASGEEICVTYLGGRNVYGSSRAERQKRLKNYNFLCACKVCTLPSDASITSDKRRIEISNIWDNIPHYPPSLTSLSLRSTVRAIHLLREEGYAADVDDFTIDVATGCSQHGDWASVEYWQAMTYAARVAEFGEDSYRANEVRDNIAKLGASPHANSFPRQDFTHIRV
ncbi:SET domain-containing protein [Hygrophoropsis aurantiaca]|uniref:SET domain-containing protein n=1 Tax=Hygrophoropsis aurantiaca TaxID=72124 RepID=A0ACB8AAC4_9AGAM|nr:SET domain-containing protein [Hygrophoropsis aurantiaca]